MKKAKRIDVNVALPYVVVERENEDLPDAIELRLNPKMKYYIKITYKDGTEEIVGINKSEEEQIFCVRYDKENNVSSFHINGEAT